MHLGAPTARTFISCGAFSTFSFIFTTAPILQFDHRQQIFHRTITVNSPSLLIATRYSQADTP